MKVMLNLNNALKRDKKIKVGGAEPCWIPITYERISSFCYWCGKLGHTHKDCDSFYEMANENKDIVRKTYRMGNG